MLQLTVRAATCHEIADDPALVAKVGRLYEIIEKGSNAKAMIFPWLPNSAVKAKDGALREVYAMISNIIEDRRASGSKDQDAVQVLIDLDDSTPDISGVSFRVLWAYTSIVAEYRSTVCSWNTFRWNHKHRRKCLLVSNVSQW